ncbi:MAG: peptidylprolyl isomerase [Nannocystaceae bacterium]|nr:peptidylprolyl isomerase [Nannocystaceae bacterium]
MTPRALLLPCWLCLACASAPGVPGRLPAVDEDLKLANETLGDPYGGRFPYAEAVEGLAATGPLRAVLETSAGAITCTLEPEHAPLAVANFVGLARGLRPFRGESGTWTTAAYYDGMPWHRAIEGQFVQTGRRGKLADGGFLLQDEIGVGDDFSRPGVMAMAGVGALDTSSVQFFITTSPAKHLVGAHTILGSCEGQATLRKLEQAVLRGEPASLDHVEVTRG